MVTRTRPLPPRLSALLADLRACLDPDTVRYGEAAREVVQTDGSSRR